MTSVPLEVEARREPRLALDDLLDRSHEELSALYEGATVPRIDAIRGDLRGRMLCVVAVPAAVRGALRALAGSRYFPWRGKSFSPGDALHGEGINRVVSDRLRLFRFETSIGRSRAGDFDAVQLDYDRRGNPKVIRMIKDEIRQLRPGLYLGQAYLKTRRRARLVLWFGLEG